MEIMGRDLTDHTECKVVSSGTHIEIDRRVVDTYFDKLATINLFF